MQRISIGFHSAPPLAVRVTDKELDKLRKALGAGDGWHTLEADDGSVELRLEHVLWVRVERSDARVGFGLSS